MDNPLIQIIIIGLFVGVIFITSFFSLAKKKSDQPPLPKTIHKIIAVIFCALFLSLGFFLGKYSSSNDMSDQSLESKRQKTGKPYIGKKDDVEVKKSSLTLQEYLQQVRSFIDNEDFKNAAYLVADTTGVSPEDPPSDLHKLPEGIREGIGNQESYYGRLSKAYLLRAFALRKLGKWSLAIANYNAAMNLAPGRDHIYFKQHIAAVYRESGNDKAAIANYNAVIDEVRNSPHPYVDIVDVYYGLGLALESEESVEAALKAYQNAQRLAFEYAPCECYDNKENRADPFVCKFVDFDKFPSKNNYEQRANQELKQQFERNFINKNPKPKEPKLSDYVDKRRKPSRKRLSEEEQSQRREEKRKKEIEDRQKFNQALAKYPEKLNQWEKEMQAYVEDEIRLSDATETNRASNVAKNRSFGPESALAFVYLTRGKLYLKNSIHKDSTIHDFMNLVNLCGLNQNGACTELKELLGEKNYQELRSLLSSQKEDAAVAFLSDTLKKVTVAEEEEAVLSLKGWKLWGLIGVLVLIIASFLVIWRKKEAKEN